MGIPRGVNQVSSPNCRTPKVVPKRESAKGGITMVA